MKRGAGALAGLLLVLLSCAGSPEYEVKGSCKDGLPDGPYELRLQGTGTLQVAGSYDRGAKNGLFTFYDPDGHKIAEIPYLGDLAQGPVKVWYPPVGSDEVGPLKLDATYMGGVRDGLTTSWYESGAKRSEHVYMGGVPRRAQYWSPEGENTMGTEVAERTAEDERSTLDFFDSLSKRLVENAVPCSAS